MLHTVEAFYSEHRWDQGVCDLHVIRHRQPHTSLFVILSETLSRQTTFPVPKFPLQSILPMVGITHTPDPCPEYLPHPHPVHTKYNLTLTLTLTQSRLPSPHPHTCSHFIDSGSMSTGGPAMLTVPSQNV